jgi:hypothetical protein
MNVTREAHSSGNGQAGKPLRTKQARPLRIVDL